MAHQTNEDLYTSKEEPLDEIKRNSRSVEGVITRYILNTKTVTDDERLQRVAFGERDERKPHKTILLVGETGVGKSTIINALVTYMLGVESKDKIWFEIIETKEEQTVSQTNTVTVYDVFTEHSPFSLTTIDTPGFGNTEDLQEDFKIVESLYELFKDGVNEIDAVCLVLSSHTARLTDRQLYVFDSVLSLFGSDVDKNIVLFITHASGQPINAIKAIKQAKVLCVQNDKGEPVYFRFNNSHCQDFNNDTILADYQASWNELKTTMDSFQTFLDKSRVINLKTTVAVLRNRKQLAASITNLKFRIRWAELKQKELEQTEAAALQEQEEKKGHMGKYTYVVDEPYKEKLQIEYEWWNFRSREATCCEICEENCHYPGCWWAKDLSLCSVMSKGKCTVCTGRCDYTAHVKEGKLYVVKTRRVERPLEYLKTKYEKDAEKTKSLLNKLKSEKEKHEREKLTLVNECYQCLTTLNLLALKTDSVFILEHMDFLIEKVNETKQTDRVKELEEIKKRVENENPKLLKFMKRVWKECNKD